MLDNSIILKLESLCARSEESKVDLSAEGATDNMAKFTQLNKEFSEITPVVNLFKSLKDFEEELSGAKELLDYNVMLRKSWSIDVQHRFFPLT